MKRQKLNRERYVNNLYLFGALTDNYFSTQNEFNFKPYSEYSDEKITIAPKIINQVGETCLLYTSDAADE